MFNTYRLRLISHTVLLTAFLVSTLLYSYIYSRGVILEESENSLATSANLINSKLESEEMELLRYAEIVRDDLRIQEYMFMITRIGTGDKSLTNLIDRLYGWLPADQAIIISITGKQLYGQNRNNLVQQALNQIQTQSSRIFYTKTSKGLELVTWSPISYQDTKLGFVALTKILNNNWLKRHHQDSNGLLFLEQDGVILLSTDYSLEGKSIVKTSNKSTFKIDNESFLIHPIQLVSKNITAPKLWYGSSEEKLLFKLSQHRQTIMSIALAGSLAILLMGSIIIRNFYRPLTELMQMTRAVADGELPIMDKNHNKNEIGMLANQFSEMLHALREKQKEIDRAHKDLEKSAITDSLTSLHNRRYLQDVFQRITAQAHRDQSHVSGILMDLDHFKLINDRYGHLGGDQCLVHFSQLLKETSRANDYVFRIGGEEFFLISVNDTREGGASLAEKIRTSLEQSPVVYNDSIIPMTVSVGISYANTSAPANEALTSLLFYSDKALYQAKENGRNQVRMHITPDDKNHSMWNLASKH